MLERQLFMDTWTDRLVENIISPHCGAEENLDGAASGDMLLKAVTGGRQSCRNGVRRWLF